MTNLLTFLICSAGLTWILVYGSIFDRIRPDWKVLKCPACVGWWVGLTLWFVNDLTTLFTFEYVLFNGILLGCASSITSWLSAMVGLYYENESH